MSHIFCIYIYIYKHSQSINCQYQKILNEIHINDQCLLVIAPEERF